MKFTILLFLAALSFAASAEVDQVKDNNGQYPSGGQPSIEFYDEHVHTGVSLLTEEDQPHLEKKLYEINQLPPTASGASPSCGANRSMLRQYTIEWNNKRKTGYQQIERDYYQAKIIHYRSEVKLTCK